ncbi:hypothetical protein ABMY20_12775 [Tenacibaculum sp. SSH1-16]|uniref:hypothetical protein n=1 Tax=Tenacibaculum sp. SSH1-16 TaxID=3136667 RepID=UPI0032C42B69
MNSFLNQLDEFGKFQKATIVYKKCLNAGKTELAAKIKQKYKLYFKSDDAVDALIYSLNGLKRINNQLK